MQLLSWRLKHSLFWHPWGSVLLIQVSIYFMRTVCFSITFRRSLSASESSCRSSFLGRCNVAGKEAEFFSLHSSSPEAVTDSASGNFSKESRECPSSTSKVCGTGVSSSSWSDGCDETGWSTSSNRRKADASDFDAERKDGQLKKGSTIGENYLRFVEVKTLFCRDSAHCFRVLARTLLWKQISLPPIMTTTRKDPVDFATAFILYSLSSPFPRLLSRALLSNEP